MYVFKMYQGTCHVPVHTYLQGTHVYTYNILYALQYCNAYNILYVYTCVP